MLLAFGIGAYCAMCYLVGWRMFTPANDEYGHPLPWTVWLLSPVTVPVIAGTILALRFLFGGDSGEAE